MREERPIRGITFDLDGTLTDSAPGLTAALDRALSEQGLPQADLARIATWIGNGGDALGHPGGTGRRAASFHPPALR